MKTIRARITNIFADGNISLDTGRRADKKIVYTTINKKDFYRFGFTVIPEENSVLDIACEKHGRKPYTKEVNGEEVQFLTKNYKFFRMSNISVVKDPYANVVEDDETVTFEKENKKPAPKKRATRKKASK